MLTLSLVDNLFYSQCLFCSNGIMQWWLSHPRQAKVKVRDNFGFRVTKTHPEVMFGPMKAEESAPSIRWV